MIVENRKRNNYEKKFSLHKKFLHHFKRNKHVIFYATERNDVLL